LLGSVAFAEEQEHQDVVDEAKAIVKNFAEVAIFLADIFFLGSSPSYYLLSLMDELG
jgi:hypothetical protein